ncbi:MAG: deoxynucleoside kinase [Rikenellaceae bacterium]
MYIAIAGNIGSGKTTLTEMLSQHYGARSYFEEPNNPYIGDFYESMSRWSFHLQIYFLGSRIEQLQQLLADMHDGKNVHFIQDRTIFEDGHIFASNLHEMGLMSTRDFNTYMKTFELFTTLLPKPDLLIYLKASVPTLVSQIKKRGRDYESNLDSDYLSLLNERYDNWIENIYQGQVYVIDKDWDDFESESEIFDGICQYIDNL